MTSLARLGLAVSLASVPALLATWHTTASASQPRPSADNGAVQVLADIVLIEAECRQVNVDYGKLFAYAERNGVRPVEIMPLGERRAAFDAAYRRRARELQGDQLCVALARERDADVPGVFVPR